MCENKILLVRSLFGKREWSIPGGYVEANETVEQAVAREVSEETGVVAPLEGLIGVRHRVSAGDNSAYLIFLMRAETEQCRPDQTEVSEAKYFALNETNQLNCLNLLTRMVVEHVMDGHIKTLSFRSHPNFSRDEYALFL